MLTISTAFIRRYKIHTFTMYVHLNKSFTVQTRTDFVTGPHSEILDAPSVAQNWHIFVHLIRSSNIDQF